MRKNVSIILAGLVLTGVFTGCYSDPGGRMHTGVPLVKDKFESRYEKSPAEIFAAAKEVLRLNGTLTGENTINNSLEAKVDARTVFVKVDEVEPKISRVIVSARNKFSKPDLDLAAEIDKQIALRLRR